VPELVEKMREFAVEARDILSDLPEKFEVTQEEASGAEALVDKVCSSCVFKIVLFAQLLKIINRHLNG
jgi:hypothetical protein